MRIEFLGVGEAFDPELGNTSILLSSSLHPAPTTLLIDCGYAIPRQYFMKSFPPDFLDGVYLTHSHADHTFGVPALVTRLYEDGRTKPLTFIGQPGTEEMVNRIIDFAYPNIRKHLSYELRFLNTVTPTTFNGLALAFAETNHGVKNFAIRVSDGVHTVGVSGDGAATPGSIELFKTCDTLIHESFRAKELVWGHASAEQIFTFIQDFQNLQRLGLVHLQRDERRRDAETFLRFPIQPGCEAFIPEPGDVWE